MQDDRAGESNLETVEKSVVRYNTFSAIGIEFPKMKPHNEIMTKTQTTTERVALTVDETANRYGVTAATIRKWSQTGAMPHARRVAGSVLRWFVSDLEEWEKTEFSRQLRGGPQVVVTRSGRM